MIRKIKKYFMGKSIKQRIFIGIALTAILTLIIFIIKGNFFDAPPAVADDEPTFHISLVDVGVLLGAVAGYSIHKIREKRKQRRM